MQRERLRQIVGGACVETGYALLHLVQRREDDDRQLGLGLVDGGQHLEPAAPGQEEIEDEQVNMVPQRTFQAAVAVHFRTDLEPLGLQAPLQEVDNSGFVLDHEDDWRQGRYLAYSTARDSRMTVTLI